jgi:hypothetical protein
MVMNSKFWLLLVAASLPALCFGVNAVAPLETQAQTSTPQQSIFPDVEPNYWARPFIVRLAERNIVVGYPDGTYKPLQAVDRDEFAAIIRKAFEQEPIRQIASGSVFKDVPRGYWASNAIEEAYQQGFLSGYNGGYFRPRQEVTKAEALVALTNGLNLTADTTPIVTTPPVATIPPLVSPRATQPTKRQEAKKSRTQIFLPIALVNLMQPLIIAQANAKTLSPTPNVPPGVTDKAPTPSPEPNQTVNQRSVAAIVNNYYTDANIIPQYAVDDVAAATQANIVVNYPDPNVLNPNQPATRGEIAAIVHQAMVAQEKIEPLPINSPAYKYIIRENDSN